jgi:tRNA threonylcarbamoyladenosine biosynthesis protein TsaE
MKIVHGIDCHPRNLAARHTMSDAAASSTDGEASTWSQAGVPLEGMSGLAERLARAVEPGLVISLEGDLGAGKTTFVRAFAVACGIEAAAVSSPTYVLVHEYFGRLPVYHFDAYRLGDADRFLQLGVEEYFAGDGVCLVEWGNLVRTALPPDLLRLLLDHDSAGTRSATLLAEGSRATRVLRRFREAGPTPG